LLSQLRARGTDVIDRPQEKQGDWLYPAEEPEGLRRYVDTIRERIWIVVIAVAITTLMAIAYVATATKTYEATANLLVTPLVTDDPAIHSLPIIFESSDPTRDVETASQFVTNNEVATRVRSDLKLSEGPQDLLKKISAAPVAQSNIVAVTATAESPEAARDLANGFARATVSVRSDQIHAAIDRQIPTIQAQLRGNQTPEAAQTLGTELAQFETLRNAQDPSLNIQSAAVLPQGQASPKTKLTIIAGFLSGLVLGIVGAFAAQALDPRLRREAQLRRLYGLPILTRVPRETRRSTKPLGPRMLSVASAESYRTLSTTISSQRVEGRSQVVLVTGSSPSEGKSTTAVNLAASLALTGKSVILLEADLRRPGLAGVFGVDGDHGDVVGVLTKEESLRSALVDVPKYVPGFRVLFARHKGGWIAELFSIPAAQKMIEDARGLADYVVIDSPPLNEVADALPLARAADHVLIVARLSRTRLDKLQQLGELLAENGIRPMGFAVIGVPRPKRDSYHYFKETPAIEQRSRIRRKTPA
jgi:polysaccharide biosynthesis transport protein